MQETDIKKIKETTEKYLNRNPIKPLYDLNIAAVQEYLHHITAASAHGDIDELILTINDIYRYGFSKGMRQAKNGTSLVNTSLAPGERQKYAEVAELISKGGVDDEKN
jgi:hypothetical protein